jgi:Zn-dependent protease
MDFAPILRQVIISVIPILFAIILHEVSHGYVAEKLGDPTARKMGRLTLNPIAHIDPFGTVIMPIALFIFTNGQFVFGYAKPVPINPFNFRNPKRDMAISAAAGPGVNILLAVLSVLVLKYLLLPVSGVIPDEVAGTFLKPLALMLSANVSVNVILAAFNLIPVPPLDGGRILMGLLPQRQAEIVGRIEPYGMIVVILLVATGLTRVIVLPIIMLIMHVLELL